MVATVNPIGLLVGLGLAFVCPLVLVDVLVDILVLVLVAAAVLAHR